MQPSQQLSAPASSPASSNGASHHAPYPTSHRIVRDHRDDAVDVRGEPDDVIGTLVPSGSAEQEAHFDIARTAAALADALERALRPHGLTSAQFNVLRILREADSDGLCRNALRERLPTRMPDVTRLLDRMEAAGMVTRERSPLDRRLVTTRITARGHCLVDTLESEVREEHQRRLGHLAPQQLRTLIDLLALVRLSIEPVTPRPRR